MLEGRADIYRFMAHLEDGHLRPIEGEELPKIRSAALVEVIVGAYDLLDKELRSRATVVQRHALLAEGERIFLEMSGNARGPGLLRPADIPYGKWPKFNAPALLVPVDLKEPLELEAKGTNRGALRPCRCVVSSTKEPAESLNDAYTIASTKHELHRRSHTGNVFLKVWWLDRDSNRYCRLHELRERVQGNGATQ